MRKFPLAAIGSDFEPENLGAVVLPRREDLAALLHVSPTSLRRYRAGERATPDDVAARLHFLAGVVGDLAGAYNAYGIRRWFHRPRVQLGGRSPADQLRGDCGIPWTGGATGARSRPIAHSGGRDVIVYRHCDPRFPFLWETASQLTARCTRRARARSIIWLTPPTAPGPSSCTMKGSPTRKDLHGVRRALWAIELKRLRAPAVI